MSKTDLPIVAVFAKAPRPGEVKTRIAVRWGEELAADLARALLRDTCSALSQVRSVRRVLATSGDWTEALVQELALEGGSGGSAETAATEAPRLAEVLGVDDVWEQGEGDLGARLERVFDRALASTPVVIAIGADSPGLPERLIQQAVAALRTHDAAIAPAEDGGFVLLGLRRCPPGLLAGLPWSQAITAHATQQRLEEAELTVARLEPYIDLDRPEDVPAVERGLASGAITAPSTASALRRLRGLPTISVVVPVLNEAACIRARLTELCRGCAFDEIVVVDGGSEDGTLEIVRTFRGVRWLSAPRGRARQQNAGAAVARGDVLLFLHADCRLPADAASHVRASLACSEVVAGAFRTSTVCPPRGRCPWWAPLLHLADLRSRYSGLPYGDQALFVRARAFARLGGFPDQPLLEDLVLARRLSEVGRIVVARASVEVSGRRFLARPFYYTALVNVIPLLWRLGVSPEQLARLYAHERGEGLSGKGARG